MPAKTACIASAISTAQKLLNPEPVRCRLNNWCGGTELVLTHHRFGEKTEIEFMNRMRVALFENRAQAEPNRQRLVHAGIFAEIHNELGLARLWFVTKCRAGVRLEVCAKDAERAQRLLAQWEAEYGWVKGAIRCPECRSMRIEYPQFTENSLLTNLTMGLMAELRFVEREYYCQDCHCMWAKSGEKPRRIRAHMAPYYFLEVFRRETRTVPVSCQAKPIRAQTLSGLKIPNCKRGPKGAGRTRFHIFKLWRRILGITLLLAGAGLLPGSNGDLITSGAMAASGNLNRTESTGNGEVEAKKAGMSHAQGAPANSETPTYLRDILPILMGKCARCHNGQSQVMQNWLDYRTASEERWEIKRRVWDSWKGTYFKQPMPTANSPESEALTDEERTTIRNWVESGAMRGVRPAFNSVHSKSERIELGRHLFATICAACHQPAGQGIPGRFPPLAGSDFLNADKHRAIKVVVNGLQGEVTVNGRRFNNSMPKFPLTDDDIANALTYVYHSFGNSGKEVTPAEVGAARAEEEEVFNIGHNQTVKVPEEKSPFE